MDTHLLLNLTLTQLSGAAVNPDNPVVKALMGNGGIVMIAWACFQGAAMLRALELGYSWLIKGDAAYLRSCIMHAAGAVALGNAPTLFGAFTGITFPTLF